MAVREEGGVTIAIDADFVRQVKLSQLFTPEQASGYLCKARLWKGGKGVQCQNKPIDHPDLCITHARQAASEKGLAYGRVDEVLPLDKLKLLLKALAKTNPQALAKVDPQVLADLTSRLEESKREDSKRKASVTALAKRPTKGEGRGRGKGSRKSKGERNTSESSSDSEPPLPPKLPPAIPELYISTCGAAFTDLKVLAVTEEWADTKVFSGYDVWKACRTSEEHALEPRSVRDVLKEAKPPGVTDDGKSTKRALNPDADTGLRSWPRKEKKSRSLAASASAQEIARGFLTSSVANVVLRDAVSQAIGGKSVAASAAGSPAYSEDSEYAGMFEGADVIQIKSPG
mmetsp:Transcript_138159/g.257799  ORF Transcript_138159/g.257799 Transcript_138159/m.257799 type:complete len:344 (-) Transcript_138159:10-1041(-)